MNQWMDGCGLCSGTEEMSESIDSQLRAQTGG